MEKSELIERQIKEAAESHRKADHAYKVNCRQDSPVYLLIKTCEHLIDALQKQQAQINCLLTIIPDDRIDEARKLVGGQSK